MKISYIVLIPLLLFLQNISSASPRIGFSELMIQAELNPQQVKLARIEAVKQGLPVNVMTTDNLMIDVKSIEDGKLVYAVITDFLNPYNGGYTAFYEDISTI